jgi:PEP-CTERM motif
MKFSHIAAAAAVAFCAMQAHAGLAGAPSVAGGYAPISFEAGAIGLTTEISSVSMVYLAPEAPVPTEITDAYSVIAINGSATLALGSATTYTFLWGSPDTFNTVSFDGKTYTGDDLLGFTASGDNTQSMLATITVEDGYTSLGNVVFASTGTAFELAAVAPVPEPETYALMLAGLAAVGFIARRRKSA